MLTILAISGSTRAQSTNTLILQFLQRQFADSIHIELFEGLANLPHFNPDLDKAPLPESVVELRNKIDRADGVIFCTPEYVFSLPGALKNAIEWTVSTTVFSEKPVALITASTEGTKAHEALNLIMRTIYSNVNEQTNLLLQGVRGQFDTEGNIKNKHLKQELCKLMEAFLEIIKLIT
ncbi:MAG: NADPH-dependent FMN reductase [Calditrichia bacterium]